MKNKRHIKQEKKAAEKAIELNIVTHLKDIVSGKGIESKKLDKLIKKESKKIAGKFAKHIKFNKQDAPKADDKVKVVEAIKETPAPAVIKEKAVTPAAKKTAVKSIAK